MHHERRVWGRGLDCGDVLAHGERRVAADGVRCRRPRPPRLQTLAVDLGDVVDVGPAAILPAELDRERTLLARVPDRLAHHSEVGLTVVGDWPLEPTRCGNSIP